MDKFIYLFIVIDVYVMYCLLNLLCLVITRHIYLNVINVSDCCCYTLAVLELTTDVFVCVFPPCRVLTIQGNLDAVLNVIQNVLPSLEEVFQVRTGLHSFIHSFVSFISFISFIHFKYVETNILSFVSFVYVTMMD